MKKIKMLVLLILIVIPNITKAQDTSETTSIVLETIKYYKTIEVKNSNNLTYSTNQVNISKTIEITKEEFESSSTNNNTVNTTIETTYKKMTTTIEANSGYYRYKVVLYWKNNPSVRSYDVIAIGHYASVKPRSAIKFSQEYCTSSTSCTTTTSANIKTTSTGTGATFKLQSGTYSSITQTLYFDVEKVNNTTVIRQRAVGDYAHAVKNIKQSTADSFQIDTDGIYFDSGTSDNFDTINSAITTWNGNW